jgi:hypothetical protein
MSRRLRRTTLVVAAALAIGMALVEGAAARGGGRGGAGGGRGGGGVAARGSFGQNRAMYHNAYNARGPAADGDFGWQQRHERRQERRERRDDVPVIYYDDYYDDDYTGGGYDSYDEAPAYDESEPDEGDYDEGESDYDAGDYGGDVYDELPCQAAVVVMRDAAYYVCDGVWYTRAYSDGELVYVEVPAPAESDGSSVTPPLRWMATLHPEQRALLRIVGLARIDAR